MTVTTRATVQVGTADLRRALTAVAPHMNKVKTGDALAQHRMRLTFAGQWLFVAACNAQTTALARVALVTDSRGASGKLDGTPGPLDKDDAPLLFDLQPRRVKLILQQFKSKPAASDIDQMVAIDCDIEGDERTLDLTDVGGLWSEGESVRYPCEGPAEAFPDLLATLGVAVANADAVTQAKHLVQDGTTLALFAAATKAYGAPLDVYGTGPSTEPGFIVTCSSFVGTVISQPGGDETGKRRNQELETWRKLLPMRRLASA